MKRRTNFNRVYPFIALLILGGTGVVWTSIVLSDSEKISVEIGDPKRTIPTEFFGFGIQGAFDGPLYESDNKLPYYADAPVTEIIAGAPVEYLRIFGGTTSLGYRLADHQMGRLIDLCAANGINSVVYVANVLQPASEALKVVDTLARAGIQVLAIEAGNEYYFSGPGNIYRELLPTVADYIAWTWGLADTLKASYPRIPIGVCMANALVFWDTPENPTGENVRDQAKIWNTQIADAVANGMPVDAWITHQYLRTENCDPLDDTCLLGQLNFTPRYVTDSVVVPYYLDLGRMPIWVTEWAIADRQYLNGLGNTFGEAAHVVTYLMDIAHAPAIEMAAYQKLIGRTSGAGILSPVVGDDIRLGLSGPVKAEADAVAFEMLSWLPGATLLKSESQTPDHLRIEVFESGGSQKLVFINRSDSAYQINFFGIYGVDPSRKSALQLRAVSSHGTERNY